MPLLVNWIWTDRVQLDTNITEVDILDFELKKVLLPPPLGNFADISYLKENFKPHLLRDVCTLCSGALVSDSLLHMLLKQTKEKIKMKVWATERRH